MNMNRKDERSDNDKLVIGGDDDPRQIQSEEHSSAGSDTEPMDPSWTPADVDGLQIPGPIDFGSVFSDDSDRVSGLDQMGVGSASGAPLATAEDLDLMNDCAKAFLYLRSDENQTDTHVSWKSLDEGFAAFEGNLAVTESADGREMLNEGLNFFDQVAPSGPMIPATPMSIIRTLQKVIALSMCRKLAFGRSRSFQEAVTLLYGETGRSMRTCQDCVERSGEDLNLIRLVVTSTEESLLTGVSIDVQCFVKGRSMTCYTLALDVRTPDSEATIEAFGKELQALRERKLILVVECDAVVEVAVAVSWEATDLQSGSKSFSPAHSDFSFKGMRATLGSESKCTCQSQPCLLHIRAASRTILSTINREHGYNRALIFASLFVNIKSLLPAIGLKVCTSMPVQILARTLLGGLKQGLKDATAPVRQQLLQEPSRQEAFKACLPTVINALLDNSTIVRREEFARSETGQGSVLQGLCKPEQLQPMAKYPVPGSPAAVNHQKIPAGCTEEEGIEVQCDSLDATRHRNRRIFRLVLEEMTAQGHCAGDELTKFCNSDEKVDLVMRVALQQFREDAPERFHDPFSSFLERHGLKNPIVQSAICVAFVEVLRPKSAVHSSNQKPHESPQESMHKPDQPKRRKCSDEEERYGMSRSPSTSRSGRKRNSCQPIARGGPVGDVAEDASREGTDAKTPTLASLLAWLHVLLLFARLLQPANFPERFRVPLLGRLKSALGHLGIRSKNKGGSLSRLLRSFKEFPSERHGLGCAHLLKAEKLRIDSRLDSLFTVALETFLPRDAPETWKMLLEHVFQLVIWRTEVSGAEAVEDAGSGFVTQTVADAARRGKDYAESLGRKVEQVAETGNCGWESFGCIARVAALRLGNTAAPWLELPNDKIGKLLVRFALAEKNVKEFFDSTTIASLINEIRTAFISGRTIKAVAIAYRRNIYVIEATDTENWITPEDWNGDPPVRVYSGLCNVGNEYESRQLYHTVFSPKIGLSDIVLVLTSHGETDDGEDMLHLQPTIGYGTEYSQNKQPASVNALEAVRRTDQQEFRRTCFALPQKGVLTNEVNDSADSLSELQLSDNPQEDEEPHLTPIKRSADGTLRLSEEFIEAWAASANEVKVFAKLVLGLNLTKHALGEQLRKIRLERWQEAAWEPQRRPLNALLMASLRSIEKATKIEAPTAGSDPSQTEERRKLRKRLDELGKNLIKRNIELQLSIQYLAVEDDVELKSHLQRLEERFNLWSAHLQRKMWPSTTPWVTDREGDTNAMDVESQVTDSESLSTDVQSQWDVYTMPMSERLSTKIGGQPWKPRENTFDFIEEQLNDVRSALESHEKAASDNPEHAGHEEISVTLRSMMRRLASVLPKDRWGRKEADNILNDSRRTKDVREEQHDMIAERWKLTEEGLANLGEKLYLAPPRKLVSQERRNSARMEAVQNGLRNELLILTKLAEGDSRRGYVRRFMGFSEPSSESTGLNFYFEKNTLGSLNDLGGLFASLNRNGKELLGSRKYLSTVLFEMFYGAARGLEFLHHHGILHRDVRPCNLLVFSCDSGLGLTAKLGNFASAKDLDNRITHTALDKSQVNEDYIAPEVAHPHLNKTQEYIAPEACREEGTETARYSYPADYWSFGKILDVFSGELFEGDAHEKRREVLGDIVRICRDRDPALRYGRCTYDGLCLSAALEEVRRTAGEKHCGEAQIFGIRLAEASEERSRRWTRK